MPHYVKLNFKWIPGQATIDTNALERMRENFPMPNKKPFSVHPAHFEYYEDIEKYKAWDESTLTSYINDSGSTISCHARLKILIDWFHHILPFLIENTNASQNGSSLFYEICEHFYHMYPGEIFKEYFGFHHDMFEILMQIIMQERFWKDGDLRKPDWLEETEAYNPEWYEFNMGPLYDSLEFCIKYLPEQDLAEWVKSVAKIDGKVWRIQVKYWLERLKKSPADYHIPEKRAKLFFKEIRQYPSYEDI